jgi:hypothetical protein
MSATTSTSVGSKTIEAPNLRAISRRSLTGSTAMINPAPRSLAPNVAHSPMGPCATMATLSPVRTLPLSAPEIPVDAISGKHEDLLVREVVGHDG